MTRTAGADSWRAPLKREVRALSRFVASRAGRKPGPALPRAQCLRGVKNPVTVP